MYGDALHTTKAQVLLQDRSDSRFALLLRPRLMQMSVPVALLHPPIPTGPTPNHVLQTGVPYEQHSQDGCRNLEVSLVSLGGTQFLHVIPTPLASLFLQA